MEPLLEDIQHEKRKLIMNEGNQLSRSNSDSVVHFPTDKKTIKTSELVEITKEMKKYCIHMSYTFYIKMELCQKGTLEDYLQSRNSIDYQEVFLILKQLILGVGYLHQKKVTHRDLKPSNIFIDENNNIKIGDFGLSIFGKESRPISDYEGSELYLDKYHLESYNFADIYSLGVIIIELLYVFKTNMERVITLSNLSQVRIQKIFRSEILKEIIFNCVRDDFRSRYTIKQLLKFIHNINYQDLRV